MSASGPVARLLVAPSRCLVVPLQAPHAHEAHTTQLAGICGQAQPLGGMLADHVPPQVGLLAARFAAKLTAYASA